jgi:hypothetical protein
VKWGLVLVPIFLIRFSLELAFFESSLQSVTFGADSGELGSELVDLRFQTLDSLQFLLQFGLETLDLCCQQTVLFAKVSSIQVTRSLVARRGIGG